MAIKLSLDSLDIKILKILQNNSQHTIKDIAKALGVSISTVSRALQDKPEISEDTKKYRQQCRFLQGLLAYMKTTVELER